MVCLTVSEEAQTVQSTEPGPETRAQSASQDPNASAKRLARLSYTHDGAVRREMGFEARSKPPKRTPVRKGRSDEASGRISRRNAETWMGGGGGNRTHVQSNSAKTSTCVSFRIHAQSALKAIRTLGSFRTLRVIYRPQVSA